MQCLLLVVVAALAAAQISPDVSKAEMVVPKGAGVLLERLKANGPRARPASVEAWRKGMRCYLAGVPFQSQSA